MFNTDYAANAFLIDVTFQQLADENWGYPDQQGNTFW